MHGEKKRKNYLGKGTFLRKDLILSKAYRSLTKSASDVLLIFLLKRHMAEIKKRRTGRKKEYRQINNGEILFTYPEAKRYGLSIITFTRARDLLIAKGFLEITVSGNLHYKKPNKYSISDRWQKYGSDEFIEKYRKPDRRYIGFRGSKKRNKE